MQDTIGESHTRLESHLAILAFIFEVVFDLSNERTFEAKLPLQVQIATPSVYVGPHVEWASRICGLHLRTLPK